MIKYNKEKRYAVLQPTDAIDIRTSTNNSDGLLIGSIYPQGENTLGNIALAVYAPQMHDLMVRMTQCWGNNNWEEEEIITEMRWLLADMNTLVEGLS